MSALRYQIGDLIRTTRTAQGLSMAEVCAAAGIKSVTTLHNIETGKATRLSIERAERVLNALGRGLLVTVERGEQ